MQELLYQVVFYVFAGLTAFSALMVVIQNNPVRCVLFLVLAFFCSAVLWLVAEAEFLSLILVLVYVGAVMTLFLFVVMMLNIDTESRRAHTLRYLPFGLLVVALLVGLLMVAIPEGTFPSSGVAASSLVPVSELNIKAPMNNTEALGMVLYTDYVYAFEIAAVILLVAIIAAITLAHRAPRQGRRQDVVEQMMTRPEDRVRLVSMKPGKNV